MVMDPELGRKFQYRFHVDFIGSLAETSVQNAIVHLKVCSEFGLVSLIICIPCNQKHGLRGTTSLQYILTKDSNLKIVDS